MLGRQIGELQGQITGTRIVSIDNGIPTVEVSFQSNGMLLDQPTTDMGTYVSEPRADGALVGDGQGVSMTADGTTLTWRGTGLGHMTGPGTASWRGSVIYESASPAFAELTSVAVLFEFDSDESGKVTGKFYEWK
jgi:hypothetical protein